MTPTEIAALAELAERAEREKASPESIRDAWLDFHRAASPSTIKRIIASHAALRAENEEMRNLYKYADAPDFVMAVESHLGCLDLIDALGDKATERDSEREHNARAAVRKIMNAGAKHPPDTAKETR